MRRQDGRVKEVSCRTGLDPFGLPRASGHTLPRDHRAIPAPTKGRPAVVVIKIWASEGPTRKVAKTLRMQQLGQTLTLAVLPRRHLLS